MCTDNYNYVLASLLSPQSAVFFAHILFLFQENLVILKNMLLSVVWLNAFCFVKEVYSR